MGEVKLCTPTPSSKSRLSHDDHLKQKDTCTSLTKNPPIQSISTQFNWGKTITQSEWLEVRCGVWFLASEIVNLDHLQLFAKSVESTYPLDIKRSAEILARAQRELEELVETSKTHL
jgi:hypothetical protein